MKAQLIKTRNHFLLSAASGLCAAGRRLPGRARPPGLQTTAPTHAVPITLPAPVASSSGLHSWEMGICRAAKSIPALPGGLTSLGAFTFPDCRAFGLRAMSLTVSELWGCSPRVIKPTAGGHAATNIPSQPCPSILLSPTQRSCPLLPSSLPLAATGAGCHPGRQQTGKSPCPRGRGAAARIQPPLPIATAPGVLEALASSNHGYARQQLDRVPVLHAEN